MLNSSNKSPFKKISSSSDPFSKSTPTLKKASNSRSPPQIEVQEDSSSAEDLVEKDKNGKVEIDGKIVKEMYRMMKTLKKK